MNGIELLLRLMEKFGDNPNSLAEKLNKKPPQSQIYKFVEGIAKEPRRSTLKPIADHYGISVEAFYDPKTAATEFSRIGGNLAATEAQVKSTSVTTTEKQTRPYSNTKISGIGVSAPQGREEFVINHFDTGGAMGHGVVLKDQPGVIASWNVTPEWLQKNVPNYTSVDNLCIVTGFGDSMLGMFNPGDPILVDKGITTCEFDGVYFFRVGDDGFIKRLQRIPGEGVLVISENSRYRDWTIKPDMDFQVFAKVVKVWKGDSY